MKMLTPVCNSNELLRPAFRRGTSCIEQTQEAILEPNQRKGIGNRILERDNFKSDNPIARLHLDFEKLQAQLVEKEGIKVRFSDKTLDKLIGVDVPDPTDLRWIQERDRLILKYQAQGMTETEIRRELEVNKPLGRPQRTIRKQQNVAQASLTTKQQFESLERQINEGRVESDRHKQELLAQFALAMRDIKTLEASTNVELNRIATALAKLGVPVSPQVLGLDKLIVDINYYKQHAGLINLLLFSKVRTQPNSAQYNYDLICKNFANNPQTGLPAVKLSSMTTALSRRKNRLFLDLLSPGLISEKQMRTEIKRFPADKVDITIVKV